MENRSKFHPTKPAFLAFQTGEKLEFWRKTCRAANYKTAALPLSYSGCLGFSNIAYYGAVGNSNILFLIQPFGRPRRLASRLLWALATKSPFGKT